MDAVGNEYDGYFENGMKHGQGTIFFTNGDIYEGSWSHNFPNGVGSMIYHCGSTYAGNWENGRFHHYGVLKRNENSALFYKYEGMWSFGLRDGKGRLECATEVYDGCWKYDLVSFYSPSSSSFFDDLKIGITQILSARENPTSTIFFKLSKIFMKYLVYLFPVG